LRTYVRSDARKLAILDAAIACWPAALRVKAESGEDVDWLARAGLLIDGGDGTITPTAAAIHYDELTKP
jgi:hypothetical protein